jgi:2-keto-4-pentenoate hydratase
MARQATLRERRLADGARRVGWKTGFGTGAAMARLGTTAPLVGFLTDATRLTDGVPFSIDGLADPRVEAEVAVRLRSPISPRMPPAQVLAAVEAVAPAIEIVDMGPADNVEEILAGNVFHRAYLLGPFTDAGPSGFAEARVNVGVNGATLHADIDPAAQLGQLEDILSAVARQLPLAGASCDAGDILITGWVVTPLGIAGGEAVRVSLTNGSAVSVAIDLTP